MQKKLWEFIEIFTVESGLKSPQVSRVKRECKRRLLRYSDLLRLVISLLCAARK